MRRGETPGADVSLLKIWASETFSRISEFVVESAGSAGARVGNSAVVKKDVPAGGIVRAGMVWPANREETG